MNGKIQTGALFALGLVVGAAVVYACRPSDPAAPDPAVPADRRIFSPRRQESPRAVKRADLRERLERLEEKLAQTRRQTKADALEMAKRPFDSRAREEYEWQKNPAAYDAYTNQVVASARARIASTAEDLDLMRSVDPSSWAPEHRALFEEYVELSDYLAQHEAKIDEMRMLDPKLPPGYGYDGLRNEVLRVQEIKYDVRRRMMIEAAKMYGLSEEEAVELAEASHRVVETTLSHQRLREERERFEKSRKEAGE